MITNEVGRSKWSGCFHSMQHYCHESCGSSQALIPTTSASIVSQIWTTYRKDLIKISSIEYWCRAMVYISIGKCLAYDDVFIFKKTFHFNHFESLTSYPTSLQWFCIIAAVIAQVIVIVVIVIVIAAEWVAVIVDIVLGSSAAVLIILIMVVEVVEFKELVGIIVVLTL